MSNANLTWNGGSGFQDFSTCHAPFAERNFNPCLWKVVFSIDERGFFHLEKGKLVIWQKVSVSIKEWYNGYYNTDMEERLLLLLLQIIQLLKYNYVLPSTTTFWLQNFAAGKYPLSWRSAYNLIRSQTSPKLYKKDSNQAFSPNLKPSEACPLTTRWTMQVPKSKLDNSSQGIPRLSPLPLVKKATLKTVSNSVFIRLMAIPLATLAGSQCFMEAFRFKLSSDKTNIKGLVWLLLESSFRSDLPSTTEAKFSWSVSAKATASLFSSCKRKHSRRWTY